MPNFARFAFVLLLGSACLILSDCAKKASSTSAIPWQMFHGSVTHTGYANVTGPKTGVLKWKFNAGITSQNGPNSVAIASDGTTVVGGGTIYGLDRSGNKKWSYTPTLVAEGPAISNDQSAVYFSEGVSGSDQTHPATGSTGYVLALDMSGNLKWTYKAGGACWFGPTVGPDGTVYQGCWDGYVYALNPADGSLKWKFQTTSSGGTFSYPPTVGSDGTIYVGAGDSHAGTDHNVYALKPSDGTLKWSYATTFGREGSPTFGSDGSLLISADPALYVLNASTGALSWSLGVTGLAGGTAIVGIQTAAVGTGNTIYTVDKYGAFHGINISTHALSWSTTASTNHGLEGFPVTDANGNVYCGSDDFSMYGFDVNGNKLFAYATGGMVTEASPALDTDGTLLFSSNDGYVYALTGGK